MPTALDRLIAAVGLILLTPLIAALAVAVRATSRGPAFHRARRVGPHGEFTLHKLRTMQGTPRQADPASPPLGIAG